MNVTGGCPGLDCAACGRRGKSLSVAHEVALTLLKGMAAWSCASLALFADALHSAAQIVKRSVARRFKNSDTLSGSLLLFMSAVVLFAAVKRLFFFGPRMAVIPSLWALGVALLASASGLVVGRYIQCAGDHLGSDDLKEVASRNRVSSYLSMGVASAILLAQFRLPEIDTFAAVMVGLIIGKMALTDLSGPLTRFWGDHEDPRPGRLLTHER
jgi:divalent metal cation (Fe/Co/Zn/Cd) transporter